MDNGTKKKQKRIALIETGVNVLGNTAGIWLTYFILVIFFNGIIDTEWHGFNYFIYDGSLLIISFSFITTVLIATIRGFKINRYNILAAILFVSNSVIYARHLGIGKAVNEQNLNFLLWLPFIASIVLLFFAAYNQKLELIGSKWLKKRVNQHDKEYSIFLSFAIAGNKNSTQRNKVKKEIQQIQLQLEELGYSPIFNADNHIIDNGGYPPPAIAAKEDFSAIENSKNFLLYYPAKIPTSAILELGYALRDEDNILILTPNKEILPFLARDLNEITDKVKIVEYKSIDHICSILKNSHEEYFKK